MRYLGLALYAEGPTDYRFFAPLLRRAALDLCLWEAPEEIEVSTVFGLETPDRFRGADGATRVLEAAREAEGEFDVLLLHSDGAGDPAAARRERVDPAAALIAANLTSYLKRTVAVVPVREMEAWALVDGNALRGAFGTSLDDGELGLPGSPQEAEGALDPKQTLEGAYARVAGRRRSRRATAAGFLDAIASRVQLPLLRRVPAFQHFETDLADALRDLGYLRGRTRKRQESER